MIGSSRVVWTLGVLTLVLLLAACGDQVPATEGMPERTTTEPTSAPEPTATEPAGTPEPVAPVASPTAASTEGVMTSQPTIPSPPDAGLEPLIEQAKEDLAQRLSLPVGQIEVLDVQSVVWPDASLDCPQPGLAYAQVVTPGFRVLLEAEGQAYEYHTDTDRLVVLCGDDGRPVYPLIPVNPDEIMDGKPWMPAD